MTTRRQIAGPRGRLEVEITGPDGGETLIFHMGTPSAASMYSPLVTLGAQRGLRHVLYLRPGYGESERCGGRTVADCAADVAAVADALGVERFYTAGRSGGGPHALATAALLPDRVIAAATIAGCAPGTPRASTGSPGWPRRISTSSQPPRPARGSCSRSSNRSERSSSQRTLRTSTPSSAILLSDVDRSVMTGEFAEYEAESMRAGLSHGVWGWFDDDIEMISDWGFDLVGHLEPSGDLAGRPGPDGPLLRARRVARLRTSRAPGRTCSPTMGTSRSRSDHYGELLDDLIANGGAG